MTKYTRARKRFWESRFVSWWVDYYPEDFKTWTGCDWVETKHCTYWMWSWRIWGWFICPLVGHDWYDDMCGRWEHDLCYHCNDRRDFVYKLRR